MDNRALTRAFRLAAQLMELHEENPFKIRAYEGTANALEALSSRYPMWSAPACPTARA